MIKELSFKEEKTLTATISHILIFCAFIGLLASSILLLEKMALLEDPSYQPSCNFNPVVSCGSVMETDQASLFGISNSFVGMIGFSAVLTIGVAMLAGARFKAWFWRGLLAGTLFGVIFSHWLFYQGVYTIGAICPYCAAIWVVMIALFWYVLLYTLREGLLKPPLRLRGAADFIQRHHGNILVMWYGVLIVIILTRFWYYWSTLL